MTSKSMLILPQDQKLLLESYLPDQSLSRPNEPHITLTYAQSLDGQISIAPGVQTAISGPETKAMTHYLRARHDAILVGVGTANADNPSLNSRHSEDGIEAVGYDRQPVPLVLDPSGRWSCSEDCNLLRLAREGKGKPPRWIVKRANYEAIDATRVNRFLAVGGGMVIIGDTKEAVDWDFLLNYLGDSYGVYSIMVEGGGKVIEDLLNVNNREFVKTVIVTIAPVWMGKGGVGTAPDRREGQPMTEVGRLKNVKWIQMGEDVVMAGHFH